VKHTMLLLLMLLPACDRARPERERDAAALTGGDSRRGRELARHYGCVACHTIPGLPGEANVGPLLDRVGSRVYLGGVLINTPENMLRWLKNPPAVDPMTAMPVPKTGVPPADAPDEDLRDLAAFLYTLR